MRSTIPFQAWRGPSDSLRRLICSHTDRSSETFPSFPFYSDTYSQLYLRIQLIFLAWASIRAYQLDPDWQRSSARRSKGLCITELLRVFTNGREHKCSSSALLFCEIFGLQPPLRPENFERYESNVRWNQNAWRSKTRTARPCTSTRYRTIQLEKRLTSWSIHHTIGGRHTSNRNQHHPLCILIHINTSL